MTDRINTTLANGETLSWAPAADFIVQGMVSAGSNTIIELQGRLDANAPWCSISSFRPASTGMMSCRKLAEVRLAWTGNKAGDLLKAWSVE